MYCIVWVIPYKLVLYQPAPMWLSLLRHCKNSSPSDSSFIITICIVLNAPDLWSSVAAPYNRITLAMTHKHTHSSCDYPHYVITLIISSRPFLCCRGNSIIPLSCTFITLCLFSRYCIPLLLFVYMMNCTISWGQYHATFTPVLRQYYASFMSLYEDNGLIMAWYKHWWIITRNQTLP